MVEIIVWLSLAFSHFPSVLSHAICKSKSSFLTLGCSLYCLPLGFSPFERIRRQQIKMFYSIGMLLMCTYSL